MDALSRRRIQSAYGLVPKTEVTLHDWSHPSAKVFLAVAEHALEHGATTDEVAELVGVDPAIMKRHLRGTDIA